MCEKEFGTSSHLSRHIRSHEGLKPYKCHICEKMFANSRNLSLHINTHTEKTKPFRCEFCEKEYAQSSGLTAHMRSHTGEKPFKCECCGKEFKHSVSLTMHMRIHTGSRPFKCKLCEMTSDILIPCRITCKLILDPNHSNAKSAKNNLLLLLPYQSIFQLNIINKWIIFNANHT